MPPKPTTSLGRADGFVGYFRGPRERSLWTREPRSWHLRPSEGLGREKLRSRGRKARSGQGPVWQSSQATRISPPAGPIASWCHQHTSWVLGGLFASHASVCGTKPFAGPWTCMAWAEEACRAVEKATRFTFRFGLKVDDWGKVDWARDSSLHALPPSNCTCPPILETNRVNKVSTLLLR
jgi:hypothetical protein